MNGWVRHRCWHWQCHICERIVSSLSVQVYIPDSKDNPEDIWQATMATKPSFGRYVVFMMWLRNNFPTTGEDTWYYLKKRYPQWHYSLLSLWSRWLWYHVQKIICV